MVLFKQTRLSFVRREVAKMGLKAASSHHKIRKRMLFYGKVQGVGFRYEATQIAQQLALTGFAQNRPSGAVEIEVQGEAEGVRDFVAALYRVPRFHIACLLEESMTLKDGEVVFYQVGA